MKKNYLLMAVIGSLVLSGCNDENSNSATSSNNTPTSSTTSQVSTSSSSTYVPEMTVAEAVAHVADSYTINYSNDAVKSSNKYHGSVYFSEASQDGFYFQEDTLYYVYKEADGTPVYSNYGNLEILLEDTQAAEDYRAILDMKTKFTNATWDFVEKTEDDELVYVTTNEDVLSTVNFLTDGVTEDAGHFVEAIISLDDESIVGFNIKNQDGEELVAADIKRIGTSNPLGGSYTTPVLNDGLDKALYNTWISPYQNETLLGGAYCDFEIAIDNNLYVSVYDENDNYVGTDVYTFAFPDGMGSYYFTNENNDIVRFVVAYGIEPDGKEYGDIYYETYAEGKEENMSFSYAFSYYSLLLQTYTVNAGYYMELMSPSDDLYFDYVTDTPGAVNAYYIYNAPSAVQATDYVIVLQFATMEAAADVAGLDTHLFNACAMFRTQVYHTFVCLAETQSQLNMFDAIIARLPVAMILPDFSEYPTPEEGQSALDYLISYMTGDYGYKYYNMSNISECTDADILSAVQTIVDVFAYGSYGNEQIDVTFYADGTGTLYFIAEKVEIEFTWNPETGAIDPIANTPYVGVNSVTFNQDGTVTLHLDDGETPFDLTLAKSSPTLTDIVVFYGTMMVDGEAVDMFVVVAVFAETVQNYYLNGMANLLPCLGYYYPLGAVFTALHVYNNYNMYVAA